MFTGQIKWLTKYKYRRTAVVAEWLRRLTRNQFPSGSAGSNPADCEELFSFTHLWHSNCDKPLFIFHNCGIQAAPLTFIKHLTFKPAYTLWTITVLLSWSIVGSVVECSPATRAARVRFPDDANFSPHNFFHSHQPVLIGHTIMCCKICHKNLETGGIDPPTSHMLSERSTGWSYTLRVGSSYC